MPITSMICHPPRNAVINLRDREKTIPVKGYSFSGGGRGVARVELSIDGGNTWVPAKLWPIKDPSQPIYGWTFWSANLSVPDTQNEMEIICKAVDTSYNHQPESAGPIWNFRGLLNNSWHRINIKIER
ncbi:Sulfite oxidase, mitochondrial [Thelohanellus kitauei]|uniref:Sulfite oxidase, mitochondrial n=1 Tax=Thelohanellus kitauei TaxID=669202 RepID=A0A0C2M1Q3_THEKT|nr:Sulfite oxidase, mitochondrial [Thelohanellus kitauei]